jgi:hypothetical protein
VPSLRGSSSALPLLQPLLTTATALGVVGLLSSALFRRAFDRLPLEEVMTISYWRAIFGMALLAFYTGGVLPAGFALPAAIGDVVPTLLMMLVLAVGQQRGRIPRTGLLVWNTLGLFDLVNTGYLAAAVLRPWAAARGVTVGNFALTLFVVPLFIGLHLHIYARVYRERWRRAESRTAQPQPL